jgi:hypothetical protein
MGSSQDYRLMERDVQVILDVYKYRYLSVSQITSLHFPSVQMARRRLRLLTADGYLAGFTAPGITERMYYLDRRGAEAVTSYLRAPIGGLKWSRSARAPKDYYFLKHFLQNNDFRIILTKACSAPNSEIDLLGYIPEYYSEKTGKGGVVKYIKDFVCDIRNPARLIHHTPDSVFALERDGKSALFFLEIDRGTEVLTNPDKGFLKCLQFYLNYWVDGKYQRYAEDFKCEPFKAFRTLIVTTSQTRANNMRQAARDVYVDPPQVKRFIWLTSDDMLDQDAIFQPVWQSADITDSSYYKIG